MDCLNDAALTFGPGGGRPSSAEVAALDPDRGFDIASTFFLWENKRGGLCAEDFAQLRRQAFVADRLE
jgi:hypothetical protein